MNTILSPYRKCTAVLTAVVAFFLLSLAGTVQAQTTAGLSIYRVLLPDTSFLSSTDSAKVTIKNTGNTAYQGYANFYYTTDTSTFSPLLLCSTPQVMLNVNDTFQIACNITFDSTYFNVGNNIVVVWSSGNAIAPADSLQDKVFLKTMSPTLGIQKADLENGFAVYPTLASDRVYIELGEGVFPGQVFISDVSGRIIRTGPTTPDAKNRILVNTSDLNGGIYFLTVVLPDKRRYVSKFVKLD